MQRLFGALRTMLSTAVELVRQVGLAFSGSEASQLIEQKEDGLAYRPLTAQLGDRTYSGEWSFDGSIVHVKCVDGKRSMAFAGAKPMPAAERLLIEIREEKGKL